MTEQRLRWGILGAANIARKNWEAIRNSGNNVLTAVASRDTGRAQKFIDENQAIVAHTPHPVAVGGYDELLTRKDVDAVYIPLPTGLRKEWVLKAAAAGKHVLCEKPCASNLEDLREMVDACSRHGVQFMDGVMFMHSTRMEAMRAVIDDGTTLGTLRRISTAFSFNGGAEFDTGNIRMDGQLEPHGCLGDLGWYCIRFALWAMKWELPERVSGTILRQSARPGSPSAVPTEFSGELHFRGGVSVGFYCSFLTENQQWVHLSGTHGSMRIDDFVLPFFGSEATFETQQPFFRVAGCTFNMESRARRHSVEEYSNNHASSQETRMFRNFASQVQSGKLNALWPEMAVKTQQVMESVLADARARLGVRGEVNR